MSNGATVRICCQANKERTTMIELERFVAVARGKTADHIPM